MNAKSTSLARKALGAAAWGYAGTLLKLVMQVGVQAYLARLLGPGEYGLFAIGVMVVSFALFFGDVGSSALIPRKELQDEEIRFAFTWQMLVSLAVCGIVAWFAGPIAIFVNDARAENVIRVLSLICPLNAVGGVALALLRRKLDFKIIQMAQVIGYFVGYVLLALPYAIYIEASVEALMIAWLAQAVVTSAIYLLAASHSWRVRFTTKTGRELVRFGIHSFVANIGTWALTNVDRIVVARVFSTTEVGFYSTSANLMSTPLSQINATFQQVAFAATAKLEAPEQIARVFGGLVAMVVTFAGLVYGFTFVTANLLVGLLYGDKWKDAVPFVEAFSATMFFHAIAGSVTPMLWSHGAISKDAKTQFAMAIILLTGTLAMAEISAIAVAWCVVGVYGIRAGLLLWIGSRHFSTFNSVFFLLLNSLLVLFFFWFLITVIDSVLERYCDVALTVFGIDLLALMLCGWLILRFRSLLGAAYASSIDAIICRLPVVIRRILVL